MNCFNCSDYPLISNKETGISRFLDCFEEAKKVTQEMRFSKEAKERYEQKVVALESETIIFL
jgi:hypothetical protein